MYNINQFFSFNFLFRFQEKEISSFQELREIDDESQDLREKRGFFDDLVETVLPVIPKIVPGILKLAG